MRRIINSLLIFCLTLISFFPQTGYAASVDEGGYHDLSRKVTWYIYFEKELDKSTITSESVRVVDQDNKNVSMRLSYSAKNKYISVRSTNLYQPKASYTLHVGPGIRYVDGDPAGSMVIPFSTGTSSSTKSVKVDYTPTQGGQGDLAEVLRLVQRLQSEQKQLKEEIKGLQEEVSTLKERIRKLETGKGDKDQTEPIASEFYTIRYPKGYYTDASKMKEHLDKSFKYVFQEFGSYPNIKQLIKEPKPLEVVLYDRPNENADIGLWSLEGMNDGSYRLHLLAQSAHYRNCCTNTGKNFDDQYFLTTTIHEVMSIPLKRVIRQKSSGWNDIYRAPDWFVQGVQEYYGTHYGKDDSIAVMIRNVKNDRSRIVISPSGVRVKGIYDDGAVLVTFLFDTYGKEKMHKLFMSKESTFERAFAAEIGSYSELARAFDNWIARK
ncbi:hypothetical protein [Brevibacillus borstelensis]|uniref:hypothetical protein n=1 Tax=Brevibacillus borstelensis TaxID=45462 RepID=UPI001D0B7B1A|nr:hypothetical protein [Brevibacillus borstelensis]MCC0566765.1 hypothetical protein [Brevibacillus borstelensis]